MLRAYFDDSGHNAQTEILAFGGFVGADAEWTAFDQDWSALLARYDLPHFHAAKMNRTFGPLCKGWSSERMATFMTEAVDALVKRDLLGIGIAIILPDYATVVEANDWLRRRFGGPFQFCYEASIQATANWIDKHPAYTEETVDVTFSTSDEFCGATSIEGAKYVTHERWQRRLHNVTYASMRDLLPLQAADLIAYETYKYCTHHFTGSKRPLRASYRRLWEEMGMAPIRYWDKESLAEFSATVAANEQSLSAINHLLALADQ